MFKLTITRLLFFTSLFFIGNNLPGCKSGPTDADLKAAVESNLKANTGTSNITVAVKDAVVTLSGEAQTENDKDAASTSAAGVKGVKSVNNEITVAASAQTQAPVEITPDDPLSTGVRDAVKDYPTVTATVNDGVITVSGNIKKTDWRKLKESLDGLKPKKVDAAGLQVTQ